MRRVILAPFSLLTYLSLRKIKNGQRGREERRGLGVHKKEQFYDSQGLAHGAETSMGEPLGA